MIVLLIQPAFGRKLDRFPTRPPLGLAYLAASLSKSGYECVIVDERPGTEINDLVSKYNPDVIGISVTTWTAKLVLEKVRKIKTSFPSIFCIAGGPHATAMPAEMLSGGFDAVVHGYGEQALVDIVKALNNKESLFEIEGISFIKDEQVFTNEQKKRKTDLDDLPFPAYDKIELKNYEWCSVSSSRGCPIGCTFCSDSYLFGRKINLRSAENFVSELEKLYFNYGVRKFYFVDEQFTFNESRVIEICEKILAKGMKIDWMVNSRVDRVTFEMLSSMKKAGCLSIAYGVESGSEKILKTIHKNIKPEQVINAVTLTKKTGIRAKTSWIVGLPGAISEQVKSIQLMEKALPNHIDVYWLTIYPGTPFWNNPDQYGIHFDPNALPFQANDKLLSKTYWFDYLSKEEIIEVAQLMTTRMLNLGYKIAGLEENDYDLNSKLIATYLRYLNIPTFSHELSK